MIAKHQIALDLFLQFAKFVKLAKICVPIDTLSTGKAVQETGLFAFSHYTACSRFV